MLRCVSVIFMAASVITGQNHKNNNPFTDIFNKFHQEDYSVIFEWAELVRCNKQFMQMYVFKTFKYNRTTTAINQTYILNSDITGDVQLTVQAYKFSSNEYREFPIRFQVNFCDGVTRNMLGFRGFRRCGNFTCPGERGSVYHICNWIPDETKFPPLIPSGRYMLSMQATLKTDEVFLQNYYGSVVRQLPHP